MTQVNRLATVVVPLHSLSYNRWLSWSGADGVTIAKVELTPESYTVDCALPVPVTKIYQTTVTPKQTVSVLFHSYYSQCHSYHSHSHHRLCPFCVTATTVTQQTASDLCNSYHSHSHNRPHPSCATATTVTHTTQSHNRPRPSFPMVKTMTHHTVTATPQTMSILSTATILILSYCYTTDHVHPLYTATILILSYCYTTDYVHPLDSHNHHSIILLRHRPCPPFPNHNKHTKQPHHTPCPHIISLTIITTRIIFCGSEKGA